MKYRHRLTGEILTIKKDYGDVVSCYCEPYYLWDGITHNVVVCAKENLIPEQGQISLF